jgi:replicative DNA helicase
MLYDKNLEGYVIGSCLKTDILAVDKVMKVIDVSDFHFAQHKRIFETIKYLFDNKKEIDLFTVNKKYDDLQYLVELESNIVTLAYLDSNIENLKIMSLKRQYIKACEKVISMAHSTDYIDYLEFESEALTHLNIKYEFKKKDYSIQKTTLDFMSNLETVYNTNEKDIIRTGFNWIDNHAGGLLNGLTYVGARPSVGKSAFVMNIMRNLILSKRNMVFFNLEMDTNSILARMVSIDAKVQNQKIREAWNLKDDDWISIAKTHSRFASGSSICEIVTDMYNIEEIVAYCKELKLTKGLDVVFIDYLQLIGSKKKYQNRYLLMTEISRQLKLLQIELGIPLWCLAQVGRSAANKMPELHELKESGSIEQDADRVFMLHDPCTDEITCMEDFSKPVELKLQVAKNRSGKRDIVGTLKYYKNTQLMAEK